MNRKRIVKALAAIFDVRFLDFRIIIKRVLYPGFQLPGYPFEPRFRGYPCQMS